MLKNLLALIGLLVAFEISMAADNNCLTCHQEFEDDTGPSHLIVQDIHIQKGLGCVDCHGGDAGLDDMDDVRAVKGYFGVPTHRDVPSFCARCHSDATYMHDHNPSLPTDQLSKYKTSVHGQRLLGQRDPKAANCISCHSVHRIGDARMPHSSTYPLNIPATCGVCHSNAEYMAEYKIPTTQVYEFSKSVHGQALLERHDLGAPACNDCHGNHGAAPPGVTSLAAVCGNCHAIEAELFTASPHRVAFEENDFPMCETCHSNHYIKKPSDAMIGAEEPAVCVECHAAGDGTAGIETAMGISEKIAGLAGSRDKAKTILDEANLKGMMTIDEEFRLKEVDQALIRTRTMVHSVNLDSVVVHADDGIEKAQQVQVNSAALIDEYQFRRNGLMVATLIITILAVALYVKIRRTD